MRLSSLARRPRIFVCALLLLGLTACEGIDRKPPDARDPEELFRSQGGKIFGDFNLLGNNSNESDTGGSGIGVNGFLWRASLDTISFLPLSSADPFGGVIITDWYSPPENPDERFKVTVFILGRELRSDGVRVSVFRQQRADGNEWRDAVTGDATSTSLENAILTRARELRGARGDG